MFLKTWFVAIGSAIGIAFATPPLEGSIVQKKVIDAPKVVFYEGGPRSPEDDPFPSSIRSFLEYKGEKLGFVFDKRDPDPWHALHCYAMGLSGAAFRVAWNSKAPDLSQTNLTYMAKDPRPGLQLAIEAIGYKPEISLRKDYATSFDIEQKADPSETVWKRKIVASIDAGIPVFALGIIGPPEAAMICGYDEGGDVLIGWSPFQDNEGLFPEQTFEPNGMFRTRDWYPKVRGLVLMSKPIKRPTNEEIDRRALEWALKIMEAPRVRDCWTGLAAYTQWADQLLNHPWFATATDEQVAKLHEVHWLSMGTLAEARAWGAPFFTDMAIRQPKAAVELRAAATCFNDIHDLVWAVWGFTGNYPLDSSKSTPKFRDANVRGRIVPLLRLMRTRDADAIGHIRDALKKMGAKTRPNAIAIAYAPRLGFEKHTCPFIGSLVAALETIGIQADYDFLMGVSGAAFRRTWNPDDGGNVDLMYFNPEPQKRAFAALGMAYMEIPRTDKKAMQTAMVQSLRQGRPVISFGIVGPPEAGLITGYDPATDTVVGETYFSKGIYTKNDWFETMGPGSAFGLITIGDLDRWHAPNRQQATKDGLEFAVQMVRGQGLPEIADHVLGLAAYDKWAESLENDAEYPIQDAKKMETRVMVHCDQLTMLYERLAGAGFLRQAAKEFPAAADDLTKAADHLKAASHHAGAMWTTEFEADFTLPGLHKWLADPTRRRDFARRVRDAKKLENEATTLIEKALKKLAS